MYKRGVGFWKSRQKYGENVIIGDSVAGGFAFAGIRNDSIGKLLHSVGGRFFVGKKFLAGKKALAAIFLFKSGYKCSPSGMRGGGVHNGGMLGGFQGKNEEGESFGVEDFPSGKGDGVRGLLGSGGIRCNGRSGNGSRKVVPSVSSREVVDGTEFPSIEVCAIESGEGASKGGIGPIT